MMKRKLILHIGTEKTGTSSIQEVLFHNRNLLNDRGFHFLQSAGTKNNRALTACCLDEDHYDDFFEQNNIRSLEEKIRFKKNTIKNFKNEISRLNGNTHTVIISSEHFHSRTIRPDEINRVKSLFDPFFNDITIVCYLREQVQTCLSLYSTAVKVGNICTLDSMIRNCNPSNVYYNYYVLLNNWKSIFIDAKFDVRRFDRKFLYNNDLIDDFFKIIDIDILDKIKRTNSSANESLTVFGQHLALSFNKAIPRYLPTGETDLTWSNGMEKISSLFSGKGESVPLDVYDSVFNRFKLSNEKLSKVYLDSKILFEYNPPKSNELTIDLEALSQFIRYLVSTNGKEHFADWFRDAALDIEKIDKNKELNLMKKAQIIRPNGFLINNKIKEYQKIDKKKTLFNIRLKKLLIKIRKVLG